RALVHLRGVVVRAVISAVVEPGELPLRAFALVLTHQIEVAVVGGFRRAGLPVGERRLALQAVLDPIACATLRLGHRAHPRSLRLVPPAALHQERRHYRERNCSDPARYHPATPPRLGCPTSALACGS